MEYGLKVGDFVRVNDPGHDHHGAFGTVGEIDIMTGKIHIDMSFPIKGKKIGIGAPKYFVRIDPDPLQRLIYGV